MGLCAHQNSQSQLQTQAPKEAIAEKRSGSRTEKVANLQRAETKKRAAPTSPPAPSASRSTPSARTTRGAGNPRLSLICPRGRPAFRRGAAEILRESPRRPLLPPPRWRPGTGAHYDWAVLSCAPRERRRVAVWAQPGVGTEQRGWCGAGSASSLRLTDRCRWQLQPAAQGMRWRGPSGALTSTISCQLSNRLDRTKGSLSEFWHLYKILGTIKQIIIMQIIIFKFFNITLKINKDNNLRMNRALPKKIRSNLLACLTPTSDPNNHTYVKWMVRHCSSMDMSPTAIHSRDANRRGGER
jgi:hypothetical protein